MPTTNPTIEEVLDANEFEMPIGYTDENGVFHKTFKLTEMTGEVDESLGDAKVRSNGAKMITEVLYGVVESIGTMKKVTREDIRKLSNPDRDFMLLMNYKYSMGDEMEWDDECTKCGGKNDLMLNVNDVKTTYMTQKESDAKIKVTLPIGIKDGEGKYHKELLCTFPNGKLSEQMFPIVRENPRKAITMMIANMVEKVVGYENWNYETFRKMSKKDRTHIQKTMQEIEVGAEMSTKAECFHCGETFQSAIPIQTLLGE